ncbi:formylglycine-generating enzyme family protein [Candidatus Entotheonella palauensis]|uniref:formylglycine-generating enzyme family protein n=1 Tax=Candidatus Entotheonella palauensis TaxID=93172 RepID=UPI0015C45DF7|nr:SUMF1/EgtB/PvdO family nonheme iron enzyme [Candidatus Entotheonella palauensis]
MKPLKRFAIDRYEASVGDYKRFLASPLTLKAKHTPSGFQRWEDFEQYPVVGLNWFDAKAYCESVGKRLPTAAEWQAAAGGGVPDEQGQIPLFPWGDTYDSDRCNLKENHYRGLEPVRSEELCPNTNGGDSNAKGPNKCWSPFGVCSMVGNASEWVDEHRIDVAGEVVKEPLDENRVVRRPQFSLVRNYSFMGGSFIDPGRLAGMVFARTYIDPHINLPHLGVRCATDLGPEDYAPDDMVAIGPFSASRNGPPELPYVLPLRGLNSERAAELLGKTLALLLSPHQNPTTNDFFLDIHPISESEYQDFIRITGGRSGSWSHPRQPQSKQTHALGNLQGTPGDPVQNVDWWDAYAYCQWRGKRLPKRIELEIAYSGGTATTYPWGNQYRDEALINYESPYGVEALVSSFTEWTQDFFRSPLIRGDNPRVVRGGILRSELTRKLFAMSRFHGYADANRTSSGFRCARDISDPMLERLWSKYLKNKF